MKQRAIYKGQTVYVVRTGKKNTRVTPDSKNINKGDLLKQVNMSYLVPTAEVKFRSMETPKSDTSAVDKLFESMSKHMGYEQVSDIVATFEGEPVSKKILKQCLVENCFNQSSSGYSDLSEMDKKRLNAKLNKKAQAYVY